MLLRPFRSLRNSFSLQAVAAILTAAAANAVLSGVIFRAEYSDGIAKVFNSTGLPFRYRAFQQDLFRMRKMKALWPPNEDRGLLSLIYSSALYVLLTKLLINDYTEGKDVVAAELFSAQPVHTRIVTASVAGVFDFVLLLPMQRLGEMHTAVLLLNLLHNICSALLCSLAFSIVFCITRKKEKNE